MLEITVSMHCGLPDPQWSLYGGQAYEVASLLAEARAVTSTAQPYPLYGFRGIEVRALSDQFLRAWELPEVFWVANGRSDDEKLGAEVTRQLLETSPAEPTPGEQPISEEERSFVQAELEVREQLVQRFLAGIEKQEATPEASAPPACDFELDPYNASWWNNNVQARKENKAYAYACNRATNTKASPGRASRWRKRGWRNIEPQDCRPGGIDQAAKSDGLVPADLCQDQSAVPRYRVALAVNLGQDYHLWRQVKSADGSTTFWSGKQGAGLVSNVDQSGALILDPEQCDRGPYNHFIGYFCVPGWVKIA